MLWLFSCLFYTAINVERYFMTNRKKLVGKSFKIKSCKARAGSFEYEFIPISLFVAKLTSTFEARCGSTNGVSVNTSFNLHKIGLGKLHS